MTSLVDRLLDFARDRLGPSWLDAARREFLAGAARQVLERPAELLAFLQWAVHEWVPECRTGEWEEQATVAEAYLAAHEHVLHPSEARFLELAALGTTSAWELATREGGLATLRDVLRGDAVRVSEEDLPVDATVGELLLGRLAAKETEPTSERVVSPGPAGNETPCLVVWLDPRPLPPEAARDLRRLQADPAASAEAHPGLLDEDLAVELRHAWHELAARHGRRSAPRNTEGHVLEIHRMSWEIPEPETALRSLVSLCEKSEPRVERDEDDVLLWAELPWVRSGTTRGKLRVDRGGLVAETDSAERAEQLRREVESRVDGLTLIEHDAITEREYARRLRAVLGDGDRGPS